MAPKQSVADVAVAARPSVLERSPSMAATSTAFPKPNFEQKARTSTKFNSTWKIWPSLPENPAKPAAAAKEPPKGKPVLSLPAVKSAAEASGTREKGQVVAGLAGQAFMEPWTGETYNKDGILEPQADADSATMRYIRACQASGVIPTSSVLEMVHSKTISGGSSMLLDDDLMSFAAMVRNVDSLRDVDLSGSSKLSDHALQVFLKKLFGKPAHDTLRRLDLGSCKGAGRTAMPVLISLLVEPKGVYRLTHLDLSGIQIPCASMSSLSCAIKAHEYLRVVHLGNTGLGSHPAAATRLTEILQASDLEVLGLGWNCFSEEAFRALGSGLSGHRSLKDLQLPNCDSCTAPAGQSPMCVFLESLSSNKSLNDLDLSMNGIGPKETLILEDALHDHRSINDLFLSQNPLGVDGLRSILRLLSRDSCGLKRFESGGCEGSQLDGRLNDGSHVFHTTAPTGSYVLDLGLAHCRCLLRMLYKTCRRLKMDPSQAFRDMKYSSSKGFAGLPLEKGRERPWVHAERDSNGVYAVPTGGVLTCTFSTDPALESLMEPAPSKGKMIGHPIRAANGFLDAWFDLLRLRPSWRKVAPFLARFRSLPDPAEQSMLLDALSSDFILDYRVLAMLCKDCSIPLQVLFRLLHCVSRNQTERFLALTDLPGLRQYLKVYNKCERLLLFNAESPTGRYSLNLANPSDFAVAEMLFLLDEWEAVSARSRGTEDCSQYGNWSSVRNAIYQNTTIRSFSEWILPSVDVLQFDYVTWRRPPPNSIHISEDRWETMMRLIAKSPLEDDAKLHAFRNIIDRCYIRAKQIRDVTFFFAVAETRVEAISAIFFRMTDPQNVKLARARVAPVEWEALRHRLGSLNLWPWVQPEQYKFVLDLSHNDDRVAASLAVRMNIKESARFANIKDPRLVRDDGSEFSFKERGVPVTWADAASTPTSGFFTFQYMCSAEDRNMELRSELFQKFGGWTQDLSNDRPVWWTYLWEVPEVVLDFLVHVMRFFNNDTALAFRIIDGPGGNGEISLTEFKLAVTKFGWPAFQDPEKATAVFRYLDPDNGGSISKAEWRVMDQLVNELLLSVLDVSSYIHRTFGSIQAAFEIFDTDGGQEVDKEEWDQAIQSLGFYGPTTVIYNYLCMDGKANRDYHLSPERWSEVCKLFENCAEIYRKILSDT